MRHRLRFKAKRTPHGYSAFVRGGTKFHFLKRFGIKKFL